MVNGQLVSHSKDCLVRLFENNSSVIVIRNNQNQNTKCDHLAAPAVFGFNQFKME
jgi:hypothetical protein